LRDRRARHAAGKQAGLKTVETHRATVMRKLDLSSSADHVRYAIRNKLVEA
jgi:DNA-binding NarL/FixJ family response regulator